MTALVAIVWIVACGVLVREYLLLRAIHGEAKREREAFESWNAERLANLRREG